MKNALVVASVIMTGLIGCSSEDGGDSSATSGVEVNLVNTHCPIMGHEVTDDGGRTEYKGGTVGFCCPGCIDAFNELEDAAKDEALATKGTGVTEDADGHDHGEDGHDHGEDGHDHGEDGHDHAEGEADQADSDEDSAEEVSEESAAEAEEE